MQLCTNFNDEQLVANQLRKGLDIVNDDLLMLPPRITGVDPSLAMVEEARFLDALASLDFKLPSIPRLDSGLVCICVRLDNRIYFGPWLLVKGLPVSGV